MIYKTIRKLIATSAVLLFISDAYSQLVINNSTLVIQSGGFVIVQGDVTSNVNIQGPGKLVLNGSSNQNVNMNGFSIPNLEINNPANVTLTGNAKINTDLLFTNGKLQLGNFNLSMDASPAGTITSATNAKFVLTNGSGKLVKSSLGATAFTYPIGNTDNTYNPVTIANPPSGVADDIGVRALDQAYSNGLTGPAFTKEVVDASWEINEAVVGGSNLSLTTSWAATDELIGFNRTKAGISYYIPTAGPTQGWDMLNSQTGAATGSNPYSFTRTGVSIAGIFAVGTRPVLSPLLVSPKIVLQGPVSTVNGIMSDGLRTILVSSGGTTDATHGIIPVSDPYTGLSGFTHSGSGGLETISSGIFGAYNITSNDAIVDWVFVSIHDEVSGNVVSTRAALLQRDGDIVETDGTSPLNMAGNIAGNYFLSVRHRNHLGVRSATNMPLAKTTSTSYNFSSGLGQAMAGVAPNNAMATIAITTPPSNIYGMWAGDANGNKVVRYSGPANDENFLLNTTLGGNKALILNGSYSRADLNMNGIIRYSGPGNDENTLLNTVLIGNIANIIAQPNF